MSTPFRERNPVTIGAVGIALIILLLLAAFRADDLPLIGGGDAYYAEFSESGGLQVNDEVRIAGVRVGKVDSIELDGQGASRLQGRATRRSARTRTPGSGSRRCSAPCTFPSSPPDQVTGGGGDDPR